MHIIISNLSQKPIYEQIMNQIKAHILQGQIKTNDALPSIRNLAKDLQISVITTKRAYDELEKDGFIVMVPGKGSFVAPQNKELILERRLRVIEEKLSEVVKESRLLGLGEDQLQSMLKIIYEEAD